jgi:hypothetical protein
LYRYAPVSGINLCYADIMLFDVMKIAAVIVGQYRATPGLRHFYRLVKDIDVFIATYPDDARKFSRNPGIGKRRDIIVMNPATPRLPPGISREDFQINMYQWVHLDNALRMFGERLRSYDVVFKLRIDAPVSIPLGVLAARVKPGGLLIHKDFAFACRGDEFVDRFLPLFSQTIPETYESWVRKGISMSRPDETNFRGINLSKFRECQSESTTRRKRRGWSSEGGLAYHVMLHFDFSEDMDSRLLRAPLWKKSNGPRDRAFIE